MKPLRSFMKEKVAQSCLTLYNLMLHSPWNSPGQNTGVGSHSLLQGIFPNEGSNPGLPHCRQVCYQLSHKEISPGCSLKGLMLKLKLQYFGHLMRRTDWFQIGKGLHQGCILSPCLFNFHAENIMRNAGLEEAQAGMKIAWRNINNLRYADDTTLMAESEEN